MTPVQGSANAQIAVGQRYQLLHRLSEDRFVQTWQAFDARLERAVVLRLLTEDARAHPEAHARF